MTDITVREVHAHIANAVTGELARHREFRQHARVVRQATAVALQAAMAELDAVGIIKELRQRFDAFLSENDAEIIDTSKMLAGPVLAKYFSKAPPFGSGEKRREFPDAFVVEALALWVEKSGSGLFVVSGDDLFRAACVERDGLQPERALKDALDQVVTDERLAAFVREQLAAKEKMIGEKLKSEFEGLGFHVEDEWGDVEVTVTDIRLDEEPDLIEMLDDTATAQMTFKADYNADLSYDDSTTGMWDAEDKRQLFMDHVTRSVTQEIDLVGQVEVKFKGLKPRSFHVLSIDLVEPSRGFGISPGADSDEHWR